MEPIYDKLLCSKLQLSFILITRNYQAANLLNLPKFNEPILTPNYF